MKTLLASILSGFLLISVSVFAADKDYTQTQNKVDDRDNAPKPYPSQSEQKKDLKSSDKSGTHPEGHRPGSTGSGSGSMDTGGSSDSGTGSAGTGTSGGSSSRN
ncbi:hypothetical protein SAMN05428977_102347 [Nitrosomonas sp. Nm166]|nr:hypothetical protein SAMN05428977_102347 [Nitrosomonas sp. Nm166]